MCKTSFYLHKHYLLYQLEANIYLFLKTLKDKRPLLFHTYDPTYWMLIQREYVAHSSMGCQSCHIHPTEFYLFLCFIFIRVEQNLSISLKLSLSVGLNHHCTSNRPRHCWSMVAKINQSLCNIFFSDPCFTFYRSNINDTFMSYIATFTLI